MMPEEEGVTADERPTVQAGPCEARPDRRMREARTAEGSSTKAWSTDMGEMRTAAHATDMHTAEAARVHAAATEVATTAKAAAVHPAATSEMPAAAETASATTSGENGRCECQCCDDGRRGKANETPVVHRKSSMQRDNMCRAGRIR